MLSQRVSTTGRFFSLGIWIDHFPPSLFASSSQAGMMLSYSNKTSAKLT